MISSLVLLLSQFKNESTRHALQTYFIILFLKRQELTMAHNFLCAIHGNEALAERQFHQLFARFCFGYFSLKNAQLSGHPFEVDTTHIKAIIDSGYCNTRHNTAEKLNVFHA